MNPDRLLTIPQAAQRRGCPPDVLYAHLSTGRLPLAAGGKVRGDRRVRVGDVDALPPYKPYRTRGGARATGAPGSPPQARTEPQAGRSGGGPKRRRSRAKEPLARLLADGADRWDLQLLATFTEEELRTLSYALYFSILSGRLRDYEGPVVARLMARFARVLPHDDAEVIAAAAKGEPVDAPPPPLHLIRTAA